jgi:hypothetical protein
VPGAESSAIARQASAVAKEHAKNTILVDIPSLHHWSVLGPKNILYYILREIKLRQPAKSESQQQKQQQQQQKGQGIDWQHISEEKRAVIRKIKEDIEALNVIKKIEEITTYIEKAKEDKQLKPYLDVLDGPKKKEVQDKISKETSLGVLLVLLLLRKSKPALTEHYNDIIKKTAKMLKEHMQQVNKGVSAEQRIIHNVTQYTHILHQVFPPISSASKPQQAQEPDIKQVTG